MKSLSEFGPWYSHQTCLFKFTTHPPTKLQLLEAVFVNVYRAQESIPPAYVAWRADTTNRVVVQASQAGNRFLCPNL